MPCFFLFFFAESSFISGSGSAWYVKFIFLSVPRISGTAFFSDDFWKTETVVDSSVLCDPVCGGCVAASEKTKESLLSGLCFHGDFLFEADGVKAFSVTFLDVGQGDGIVLRDDTGVTMLCDGGSSSVSNVGKYRILPYLRYHGIDRLDYVFLSHMDMDHINGVRELLERQTCSIKIKNLVLQLSKSG